jgi:hypothetical protein
MKKTYISAMFLLLFSVVYGQNESGQAEKNILLFDEGFESGVLNLKVSGDRSNVPEVIRSETARAGNYVMKSQISSETAGPFRTEVSLNKEKLIFEPGKEYWVGMSTKLDEDFNVPSNFNDQGMLFQWHYFGWNHPKVKDAQPLVGRYVNGEVMIQCEMLDNYLAHAPAKIGEWMDWVIHVKFDKKEGIFEVWLDGEQIVEWKGNNHIEEMVEGAYLKFGLYSAQFKKEPMPKGHSRTVYHDEVRIAGENGSYEMVAPKSKQ